MNKKMRTVLWWGRSDPEYSRNKLLLGLLADLGWTVHYFHPFASHTGLLESYLRKLQKPDLIWSPCFRQTDIASAAHWAGKWHIPLVIDPLISAYQKEVFERHKWPPGSPRALHRKKWESGLFARADLVVADTPAHADYFQAELQVAPEKLSVLYVSAEDDHFAPLPFPERQDPLEVLFYGSFLPLQGPEVIVRAAQRIADRKIRWTLLGDGDLRPEMEKLAGSSTNIRFEPWIKYADLPGRLARAHILLGIFGTTVKADLVIPNKMFQSMAAGRPVITRYANAYRETLAGSRIIGWVPPGDPDALAELVIQWSKDTDALRKRGRETRTLFETYFGREKTKAQLNEILIRSLQYSTGNVS